MIFQFLQHMIFGKHKPEITIPRHEVWYDHNTKLWTAQLRDKYDSQIGVAGYGTTSAQAVSDVFYQNIDILE